MTNLGVVITVDTKASGTVSEIDRITAAMKRLRQESLAAGVANKQALVGSTAGASSAVASSTAGMKAATAATGNWLKQSQLATQQGALLANAWKEGSNVVDNRYLKSISGLREGLSRLNTELATTRTVHKGVLMTMQEAGGENLKFLATGNLVTRYLDNASMKLINMGKNAQWTGRQMMVGITAPLVAIGVAAAKSAMQIGAIDLVLQRVVRGATTEDFKKLDDQTRQLSVTFGVTRQSVKEMQSEFARVGFGIQQINDAVQQSSQLSLLGNVDTVSAQKLVQVLYQTGLGFKEVQDQLEKFLIIDQQTNLNIKDTAASLSAVYPTTKRFGASVTETAALMAGITQNGLSSAEAATVLNAALIKLPTALANIQTGATGGRARLKDLQDQINEVGKETGVMVALFDQQGKQVNAVQMLAQLARGYDILTKSGDPDKIAESLKLIRALFNQGGATGGASLLDALGKSMNPLTKDGQDLAKAMGIAQSSVGAFAQEWTKQLGVIQGSEVTKIQGQLQKIVNAGQDLGKKLLPTVVSVLQTVNKIVDAFANLSDTTKKFILGAAGGLALLGPIVYIAGQGLIALGTIARGLVSPFKLFFDRLKNLQVERWNFTDELAGSLQKLNDQFKRGLISPQAYHIEVQKIITALEGSTSVTEAATVAQGAANAAHATSVKILDTESAAQMRLNILKSAGGIPLVGAGARASRDTAGMNRAIATTLTRMPNPAVEQVTEQQAQQSLIQRLARQINDRKRPNTSGVGTLRRVGATEQQLGSSEWGRLKDAEGVVRKTDAVIETLGTTEGLQHLATELSKAQVGEFNPGDAVKKVQSLEILKTKLKAFKTKWGYEAPLTLNTGITDPGERLSDLHMRFDKFNTALGETMQTMATQSGAVVDDALVSSLKKDPMNVAYLWKEALSSAGLESVVAKDTLAPANTIKDAAKEIVARRNAVVAKRPLPLTEAMFARWKEEMTDSSAMIDIYGPSSESAVYDREHYADTAYIKGQHSKIVDDIQTNLKQYHANITDMGRVASGANPLEGLTEEMSSVVTSMKPQEKMGIPEKQLGKFKAFQVALNKFGLGQLESATAAEAELDKIIASKKFKGNDLKLLKLNKKNLIKRRDVMKSLFDSINADLGYGIAPSTLDIDDIFRNKSFMDRIKSQISSTTGSRSKKFDPTEDFNLDNKEFNRIFNLTPLKDDTEKTQLVRGVQKAKADVAEYDALHAKSRSVRGFKNLSVEEQARSRELKNSRSKLDQALTDLRDKMIPRYASGLDITDAPRRFPRIPIHSTQRDSSAVGKFPRGVESPLSTYFGDKVNNSIFTDKLGNRKSYIETGSNALTGIFGDRKGNGTEEELQTFLEKALKAENPLAVFSQEGLPPQIKNALAKSVFAGYGPHVPNGWMQELKKIVAPEQVKQVEALLNTVSADVLDMYDNIDPAFTKSFRNAADKIKVELTKKGADIYADKSASGGALAKARNDPQIVSYARKVVDEEQAKLNAAEKELEKIPPKLEALHSEYASKLAALDPQIAAAQAKFDELDAQRHKGGTLKKPAQTVTARRNLDELIKQKAQWELFQGNKIAEVENERTQILNTINSAVRKQVKATDVLPYGKATEGFFDEVLVAETAKLAQQEAQLPKLEKDLKGVNERYAKKVKGATDRLTAAQTKYDELIAPSLPADPAALAAAQSRFAAAKERVARIPPPALLQRLPKTEAEARAHALQGTEQELREAEADVKRAVLTEDPTIIGKAKSRHKQITEKLATLSAQHYDSRDYFEKEKKEAEYNLLFAEDEVKSAKGGLIGKDRLLAAQKELKAAWASGDKTRIAAAEIENKAAKAHAADLTTAEKKLREAKAAKKLLPGIGEEIALGAGAVDPMRSTITDLDLAKNKLTTGIAESKTKIAELQKEVTKAQTVRAEAANVLTAAGIPAPYVAPGPKAKSAEEINAMPSGYDKSVEQHRADRERLRTQERRTRRPQLRQQAGGDRAEFQRLLNEMEKEINAPGWMPNVPTSGSALDKLFARQAAGEVIDPGELEYALNSSNLGGYLGGSSDKYGVQQKPYTPPAPKRKIPFTPKRDLSLTGIDPYAMDYTANETGVLTEDLYQAQARDKIQKTRISPTSRAGTARREALDQILAPLGKEQSDIDYLRRAALTRGGSLRGKVVREISGVTPGAKGMPGIPFTKPGFGAAANLESLVGNLSPEMGGAIENLAVLQTARDKLMKGEKTSIAEAKKIMLEFFPGITDELATEYSQLGLHVAETYSRDLEKAKAHFGEGFSKRVEAASKGQGMMQFAPGRISTYDTHTSSTAEAADRELAFAPHDQIFEDKGGKLTPGAASDNLITQFSKGEVDAAEKHLAGAQGAFTEIEREIVRAQDELVSAQKLHNKKLVNYYHTHSVQLKTELENARKEREKAAAVVNSMYSDVFEVVTPQGKTTRYSSQRAYHEARNAEAEASMKQSMTEAENLIAPKPKDYTKQVNDRTKSRIAQLLDKDNGDAAVIQQAKDAAEYEMLSKKAKEAGGVSGLSADDHSRYTQLRGSTSQYAATKADVKKKVQQEVKDEHYKNLVTQEKEKLQAAAKEAGTEISVKDAEKQAEQIVGVKTTQSAEKLVEKQGVKLLAEAEERGLVTQATLAVKREDVTKKLYDNTKKIQGHSLKQFLTGGKKTRLSEEDTSILSSLHESDYDAGTIGSYTNKDIQRQKEYLSRLQKAESEGKTLAYDAANMPGYHDTLLGKATSALSPSNIKGGVVDAVKKSESVVADVTPKIKNGILDAATWANPLKSMRAFGDGAVGTGKKLLGVFGKEGGISKGGAKLFEGMFGSGAASGAAPALEMLGPISIILIAIAAVVLILAKNFKKWIDSAREGLNELKTAGLALYHAIADPFMAIFASTSKGGMQAGSVWKNVGTIIGELAKGLAKVITFLVPFVKFFVVDMAAGVRLVIQTIRLIIDIFTGDWKDALDALKDIWATTWKTVLSLVLDAAKAIVILIADMINGVIDLIQKIPDALSHIPIIGGAFSNISDFADEAKGKVNGLRDSLTGHLDTWMNGLGIFTKPVVTPKLDLAKIGQDTHPGDIQAAIDRYFAGENTPVINVDLTTNAQQAAQDASKAFISAFKNEMQSVQAGWKTAAMDSFKKWGDDQVKAIDDKIAAIDKEVNAEKRRDETLAYLQKKEDIRNQRKSDALSYRADRDAAIYEGRYDDAKALDIEYQKTQANLNQDEITLDKDYGKTLLQRQRDDAKEALNIEKQALQDRLKEQEAFLQAQLDNITKFIPQNAAAAKAQQDAILAALGGQTDGYAAIPVQDVAAWSASWDSAMTEAKGKIADDAWWAGAEALKQFADGMGIDLNPVVYSPPDTSSGTTTGTTSTGTGPNYVGNPNNGPGGSGTGHAKPETYAEFRKRIYGYHTGGDVLGQGEVPAKLLAGEYVIRRESVAKYGSDFMDQVNTGQFKDKQEYHSGGLVSGAAGAASQLTDKLSSQAGRVDGIRSSFSGLIDSFAKKFFAGGASLGREANPDGSHGFLTFKDIQDAWRREAGLGGSDGSGQPSYNNLGADVGDINTEFMKRFREWNKQFSDKFSVVSGYRTHDQQVALWNGWIQGLPGFNPAAPPGQSMHEYGLAIDVGPSANNDEQTAATKYGLRFPYDFEPWHMEPIEANQWRADLLSGSPLSGSNTYGDISVDIPIKPDLFKKHSGGLIVQVPSLDVGGLIAKSGIAQVHAGERVLNADQTAAYGSGGDMVNHFHFEGGYFGTDRELEKLVDRIEVEIKPKVNRPRGTASRTFSKVTK